jgi:addiction module HigA family antidote
MKSKSTRTTAGTRRKAAALIGGADITKMRRSPTHPGEIFNEEIVKPRGYGAQSDIARRMGITLTRLREILAGTRPVSPESAVLMGKVSGTSPEMWLHLQADYDLWRALQETDTSKVQPLAAE